VTPEDRFEGIVDEYAGRTAITLPGESGTRGFGSSALKVNGSTFATLTRCRVQPGAVVVATDEVGTTVMLTANSPAFSFQTVGDVVLPSSTSTVHWASVALKADPCRVTVVVVAPPAELAGWATGVAVEPVSTLVTVYP